MAVLFPGPLASSIHGSIGSNNFYSSGPFQCVRLNRSPTKSFSFDRGENQSMWSRAVKNAHSRYSGIIKSRIDQCASQIRLSRHGISYGISGFRLLCSMNFFSFKYWGTQANITWGLTGILPSKVIDVSLENAPNYIKIVYHDDDVVSPTLIFSWGHPSHGESGGRPSNYPYEFTQLVNGAGTFFIPPGSFPRIVGKSILYFRFRTIKGNGEYSPLNFGFVTKFNWT